MTNSTRFPSSDPAASAVIDSAAARLYQDFTLCLRCLENLTLADCLSFHCPHCGALTLAGKGPDITPERGREMLATLRARRVALGLPA